MAFPLSPTNGQTASINNIVYVYSSTTNTWTRTAPGFGNIGASGNISAIGSISAAGNVYGNYIVGNVTGTVTNAITVTGNAQPNITSVGTLTSLTSTGLISTTGNVSGNYILGNASQLSNVNANTINTTFIGTANTYYLDFVAADGANNQTVYNSPFLTYIPTSGLLGVSALTATGNISGNYIIGNGSQLTGLPAGYANSNVVSYAQSGWAGNIIPSSANTYTLGNATNYWQEVFVGPSSLYIGGNALSAVNGVLAFNGSNVVLTTTPGVISTTGNIIGGNLITAGYVSATGNITGNYIIGNGSQLTGLPASYGNANVAAYLPTYTGNLTADNISVTGNVTANYVIGNGAILSSITGANVTGTVANATYALSAGSAVGTAATVTTNAQPNITSVGTLTSLSVSGNTTSGNILTAGQLSATGNLSGGNLYIPGSANILGNLNVQGNVTFINSNVITVNDLYIELANNQTTYANINGAGLAVGPNGSALTYWQYNTGSNAWTTNVGVSASGNVTGNYYIGNGATLSSITGANVTGTVANATYAISAGTATSATTAGTVTTNAQPNITSVGTLTSLSISGNTTSGNILTNGFVSATGTAVTGVNAAQFGTPNVSLHANAVVTSAGNSNQSAQFAFQNFSNGSLASTDLALYNNQGTDSTYFIDMGILGSSYDAANQGFNVAGANDGYLYVTGNSQTGPVNSGANVGNLILGTTNGQIIAFVGNTSNANIVTVTSNTGFAVTGNISANGLITGGTLSTTGVVYGGNIAANGNITTGNLSATGNIVGSYFIGNGSQLTGLPAGNYSNANVAAYLPTYTGNLTAGNITTTGLVSASGNINTSGNINQAGTGNINGYNGYFSNNFTVIGTFQSTSNITSNGAGIFYGNVTTGDGALYAGVPGFTPLGSDVVLQLAGNVNSYSQINFQNINSGSGASTDFILTANNGNNSAYYADFGITGNNHVDPAFFGDSSTLNDIYLYAVATNQAGPSTTSGPGNLILGSSNGQIKLFVGNTAQANVIQQISSIGIAVNGVVSATGNITGNYIYGNGAFLTGISGGGNGGGNGTAILNGSSNVNIATANGNITVGVSGVGNVVTWAPTGEYVSGVISATGNITGGNIVTGTGTGGNLTGANVISANTFVATANISAIGNITGSYILGNGALLTGVSTSSSNINNGTSNVTVTGSGANVTVGVGGTANVAVFASTGEYVTGVISATGNITGGNLNVPFGGVIIASNIVVQGAGSNLTVSNGAILQLSGSAVCSLSSPAVISGTGNITAGNIAGGNVLTGGIVSATGNITVGNIGTSGLASVVGNVQAGNIRTVGLITATGNITGGNILTVGLISATSTITSAANIIGGNITTVGLLSATSTITSAANIIGGNILTAGIMSSTGNITAGNIIIPGAFGQVAIINGTLNVTGTSIVRLANASGSNTVVLDSLLGTVSATGNVTGNYFIGNGSQLTGIIASAGAAITNGNSNVTVNANANVTVGVTGTSNVVVVAPTGEYVTGVVSATGNVTTPNTISGGTITATGNVFDSIGPVRNIPINTQAANYTLAITDNGKFVSTTSNVFVPNTIFSAGNAITLFNNSAANVTVYANTSVTMYLAGTATTGNRVLAQRGMATILCVAANTFVISGAGLF